MKETCAQCGRPRVNKWDQALTCQCLSSKPLVINDNREAAQEREANRRLADALGVELADFFAPEDDYTP